MSAANDIFTSQLLRAVSTKYCQLVSESEKKTMSRNDLLSKKIVDEKLARLKRKCSQLTKIVVRDDEDTTMMTYFTLSHFERLTGIHLFRCPPSAIRDFFDLRSQLITIKMFYSGIGKLYTIFLPMYGSHKKLQYFLSSSSAAAASITSVEQFFSTLRPELGMEYSNVTDSNDFNPRSLSNNVASLFSMFNWSLVTSLTLTHCGLTSLDLSLHFFPAVEYINLSHNYLKKIAHLQNCTRLKSLNLSHNRIESLLSFHLTLGNIATLNIANNKINSLEGIDRLLSLERVDARNNCISKYHDVRYLALLPCLEVIYLENNPLPKSIPPFHYSYRTQFYYELLTQHNYATSTRTLPTLDGINMSADERAALRYF